MTQTNPPISDSGLTPRCHCCRAIKALMLAAVIFLCGGAAGWGLALLLHRPPPMSMELVPEPPANDLVERLRYELLLSDDQVTQVRQIYKERQDALHAIREKMGPELKSEYDKLDQQMKGVLTSAQYQRWAERFQSVRSRMLPPPPPGYGGADHWHGPPPPPGYGGPGPGDHPMHGDHPRNGPPDDMPPPGAG
ncbi:MAG: hypothetical protein ABSH08_01700 [Tepidisphaeraceae bacterium]|jgi:hypothetical protein